MIKAMDELGLLDEAPPLPVSASSSVDELLAFCAMAEEGYEALNNTVTSTWPPLTGVTRETQVIKGIDDNEITLYIHRPEKVQGHIAWDLTYSWRRHGFDVCRWLHV